MAVTVVGGDAPPPETVTLITRSVAYLTADAPQFRRPALERLALDYARRVHGGDRRLQVTETLLSLRRAS